MLLFYVFAFLEVYNCDSCYYLNKSFVEFIQALVFSKEDAMGNKTWDKQSKF